MTHLIKDKTMTQAIGNDGARYQLAKEGAFNVQAFGPPMTLAQAQAYQEAIEQRFMQDMGIYPKVQE